MTRPATPPAPLGPGTPMRGRYLVRNRAAYLVLRTVDAMLDRLVPRAHGACRIPPRRVLVAVGGHLGDAVLATAAIRLLRESLPDAEIGVLVPSWARPVVTAHPAIRWIHTVDHWKLNRQLSSRSARWLRHRRTLRDAVAGIEAVGYDVAVDLYPYFPNSAPLLWRAAIPCRIGYESGGLGALYTRALPWNARRRNWHTVEQHRELLRQIPGIAASAASLPMRYALPPHAPAARDAAARLVGEESLAPGGVGYVVVHPGAGNPRKEWTVDGWQRVARPLAERGIHLVFTGHGAAQAEMVERIITDTPGCTNLAGRLDWDAFRAVVAGARALIGVDTVAAHLAAAEDVPVVVLSAGMSDIEHWHPVGRECVVLQAPVECAPCHRGAGCATMACVRGISPEQVEDATLRILGIASERSPVSLRRR